MNDLTLASIPHTRGGEPYINTARGYEPFVFPTRVGVNR